MTVFFFFLINYSFEQLCRFINNQWMEKKCHLCGGIIHRWEIRNMYEIRHQASGKFRSFGNINSHAKNCKQS